MGAKRLALRHNRRARSYPVIRSLLQSGEVMLHALKGGTAATGLHPLPPRGDGDGPLQHRGPSPSPPPGPSPAWSHSSPPRASDGATVHLLLELQRPV